MRASASLDARCATPACDGAPAVDALHAQLDALRDLVSRMAASVYRAAPSRHSGTIGAHVRHCLDHVRALVTTARAAELCYDARVRDTEVEREPSAAVREIDRLSLALEDLAGESMAQPLRLRAQVDHGGAAMEMWSTLGRELAFTVQHTIHHAALIGVLLDQLGIAVPPDFGYAPSTPRMVIGDR